MRELASELQKIFYKNSGQTDDLNQFPLENLKLLKDSGLINFLIPKKYGGAGGSVLELTEIAKILGSGCLSTSMIWAMHCQQIACLSNHCTSKFTEELLADICKRKLYIGSVTSEIGNNGHLFNINTPIIYDGDNAILNRHAPIVTGGDFCDGYLITMRKDDKSPSSDIKLVFASREQVSVNVLSKWKPMGMRGTQSSAFNIEGSVPLTQIINTDYNFTDIAYETMIPIGHIAWVSCWLGATIAVFKDVKKILAKARKTGLNINSDLLLEKVARIRLIIDVVQSLLNDVVRDYDDGFIRDRKALRSTKFLIKTNNLKIFGSEELFNAITNMMDIAGMQYAYLKNDQCHLERTFRDLRSSSMMINNVNLLIANGRLTFFDKSL